jgi:hypothetical protein
MHVRIPVRARSKLRWSCSPPSAPSDCWLAERCYTKNSQSVIDSRLGTQVAKIEYVYSSNAGAGEWQQSLTCIYSIARTYSIEFNSMFGRRCDGAQGSVVSSSKRAVRVIRSSKGAVRCWLMQRDVVGRVAARLRSQKGDDTRPCPCQSRPYLNHGSFPILVFLELLLTTQGTLSRGVLVTVNISYISTLTRCRC